MTRRAEWRRPPDEPRRRLAVLRVAAQDAWALPWAQGPVIVVIGVFWAILIMGTLVLGSSLGFLVVVALFIGFFASLAWIEKPTTARMEEQWKTLLPAPLPESTFPIHVAIRYRGALTGIDIAAAGFVDGWLHVEGRRTSFAIRAGEGQTEWRGDRLRIDFLDGQSVSLWHPQTLTSACYGAVRRGRDGRWHPVRASESDYFRHASTLWAADRKHPEGESILPPLAAYPVHRSGWSALMVGALVVPGFLLALDAMLGHRIGVVGTFAIWSVGLLAGLRMAVVEAHLGEAHRRAEALPEPERGRPVR